MASLDPQTLKLGSAEPALAFTRTGGGSWTEWDRFLTLDGKPAYHIGNVCDTCEFFFQRLEGATRSLSAEQFASTFATGPPTMERAWLERVGALLPPGEYVPFYTRMPVRLVTPGGPGDYYAEEQVATWGVNAFGVALAELYTWPHHRKRPASVTQRIANDLPPDVTLLDFDSDCAKQFRRVRGELLQKGISVS